MFRSGIMYRRPALTLENLGDTFAPATDFATQITRPPETTGDDRFTEYRQSGVKDVPHSCSRLNSPKPETHQAWGQMNWQTTSSAGDTRRFMRQEFPRYAPRHFPVLASNRRRRGPAVKRSGGQVLTPRYRHCDNWEVSRPHESRHHPASLETPPPGSVAGKTRCVHHADVDLFRRDRTSKTQYRGLAFRRRGGAMAAIPASMRRDPAQSDLNPSEMAEPLPGDPFEDGDVTEPLPRRCSNRISASASDRRYHRHQISARRSRRVSVPTAQLHAETRSPQNGSACATVFTHGATSRGQNIPVSFSLARGKSLPGVIKQEAQLSASPSKLTNAQRTTASAHGHFPARYRGKLWNTATDRVAVDHAVTVAHPGR